MHAARIILLSFLAAAVFTGCNSDDIVAQRLDRSISIDGDPSEWGDLMFEVDDLDYDLGYANDDEFLYLCMVTDDEQARRQALVNGVHLWFDPEGGDSRVVGVRYPVGTGMPARTGGGEPAPEEREAMRVEARAIAEESLGQVALLSSDGSIEVTLTELAGIDVNSLLTSRSLCIEMRVPLHALEGADLSLDADPAATAIGLELYVAELTVPARSGNAARGSGMRGGGMGGGGRGGAGGGMGRGMGGGPGGNRGSGPPQGADEINEHFVIPLADSSPVDQEKSR